MTDTLAMSETPVDPRHRTFRAESLEEALAEAQEKMGEVDVVEARRVRRGGLGGFFATDLGVEVVVAPAEPTRDDRVADVVEMFPGNDDTRPAKRVPAPEAAAPRPPAKAAPSAEVGLDQLISQAEQRDRTVAADQGVFRPAIAGVLDEMEAQRLDDVERTDDHPFAAVLGAEISGRGSLLHPSELPEMPEMPEDTTQIPPPPVPVESVEETRDESPLPATTFDDLPAADAVTFDAPPTQAPITFDPPAASAPLTETVRPVPPPPPPAPPTAPLRRPDIASDDVLDDMTVAMTRPATSSIDDTPAVEAPILETPAVETTTADSAVEATPVADDRTVAMVRPVAPAPQTSVVVESAPVTEPSDDDPTVAMTRPVDVPTETPADEAETASADLATAASRPTAADAVPDDLLESVFGLGSRGEGSFSRITLTVEREDGNSVTVAADFAGETNG